MTGQLSLFRLLLVLFMLALHSGHGVARSGVNAALVLEASGTLVPLIQPFDQIEDSRTLHLTPGASLTFSHYRLCQKVSLRGQGRLEMRTGSYFWSGEEPATVENRQCLSAVTYVDPDLTSAGIGLRAMSAIEINARPRFAVPEFDRAHDYALVFRTISGARPDIRLALSGTVTDWPAETAPLELGVSYHLTLMKDSRASKQTALVRVLAKSGSTAGINPLILSFP